MELSGVKPDPHGGRGGMELSGVKPDPRVGSSAVGGSGFMPDSRCTIISTIQAVVNPVPGV